MAEPLLTEGVDEIETREGDENDLSCLMAQAARGHRVLLAGLLAEVDLYPGQERVMAALWDNGPQSQNALAKIVGIDVSTMTKSLQRLERSGFVSRSPCPTNRRISVVDTTPAGDALRPELRRVLAEANRRMTQGLTPEQAGVLSSLLALVRDNLCPEAMAAAAARPAGGNLKARHIS
ncbi:DNA-binding transcriptional regulator, MarR family [Streptosporangium subroseum]|uniref:DNA-binding transcriptional regulator, MarR family n=1 Tax=Streptosporangium subroseum TaxID=106412 RepID=A0A239JCK3_9ACTN|nr:MarR family winged helix-turn-helix transcriptional regulator [Streptosporangium subroseum]SNT02394.1 DNA-binding transcriptional regulator, MarR family [Streptosporangium subroseum]